MRKKRYSKLVQEGGYVAEVEPRPDRIRPRVVAISEP